MSITQWILGIRPESDGLRVEPVIPPDLPGFRAQRLFRGVRYEIEALRAGEGNGVRLELDGQELVGTVVPLPAQGTQAVRVRLGGR
jgi:cellobiose phosphorylase